MLPSAYAEVPRPRQIDRSFALSSGYLEHIFNSNEGLSYFPLSSIQLYSKGFDGVTQDYAVTTGRRWGIALLEFPISYWLAHSLFIPYHEFGHARVIAANKNEYEYHSYGLWGPLSTTSYWGLTLMRLFTPPFGFPGSGHAAAGGNHGNLLTPSLIQYYGTPGLDLIFSASGLNNQMLLSKKVSDLIYSDTGHMTYFAHYLGNKISGYVYSKLDQNLNSNDDPLINNNSDIKAILNAYSAKGYSITHADLERQSLISLLSGTTYSFINGYYNYISSGNPRVRTLEILGFRVPDINSYINARGLSYEFVTGYRFSSNLRVDLAYERIWKGTPTQQLTPRIHYQLASIFPTLNDFWISADAVMSRGVGGSVEARWAPKPFSVDHFDTKLSYFSRFILYNAYTLYGERNTPSFNQRVLTPEFIAGVNYKY